MHTFFRIGVETGCDQMLRLPDMDKSSPPMSRRFNSPEVLDQISTANQMTPLISTNHVPPLRLYTKKPSNRSKTRHSSKTDNEQKPKKKVSLPTIKLPEDLRTSGQLVPKTAVGCRGCSSLPPLSADRDSQPRHPEVSSDDDFCSNSINLPASCSYSCSKLPLITKKSYSLPVLELGTQCQSRSSSADTSEDSSSENESIDNRAEMKRGKAEKVILPKLG